MPKGLLGEAQRVPEPQRVGKRQFLGRRGARVRDAPGRVPHRPVPLSLEVERTVTVGPIPDPLEAVQRRRQSIVLPTLQKGLRRKSRQPPPRRPVEARELRLQLKQVNQADHDQSTVFCALLPKFLI